MKHTLIPYSDYYFEALDSIPINHPHKDEIVSLLIDQVLDDSDYANTCRDRHPNTA